MIEETLRPVEDADHPFVLDLNHRNVELLAPMDEARLRQLLAWADRAAVIGYDGRDAGFVLTFAPGTPYDSENYRWFTAELGRDFYYLDRIVLDDDFRRVGLGRAVYDELEHHAATAYSRMALEVNVEPPNEASLAFHRRRGYREVGRLEQGGKKVAMMVLDLDQPS
jgi:predicted GNAT superfamily acetyltransferase